MTAVAMCYPRTSQEDINLGVGPEDRTIRLIRDRFLTRHFFVPITRQKEISYQFQNLMRKWKDDTMFTSSTTKMCSNPSYLRIIGVGKKVLPFIFRELEREPNHWFVALEAITGDDPVSPGHIGNVREMAKDWLSWARGMGYEW